MTTTPNNDLGMNAGLNWPLAGSSSASASPAEKKASGSSAEKKLKRKSLQNEQVLVRTESIFSPRLSTSLKCSPRFTGEERATPNPSPRSAVDGRLTLLAEPIVFLGQGRSKTAGSDLRFEQKVSLEKMLLRELENTIKIYVEEKTAPGISENDSRIESPIIAFFPWINALSNKIEAILQNSVFSEIANTSKGVEIEKQIDALTRVCDPLLPWKKLTRHRRLVYLKEFVKEKTKIQKEKKIPALSTLLAGMECLQSLPKYVKCESRISKKLRDWPAWEVSEQNSPFPIRKISLADVNRTLFEGVKWIFGLTINHKRIEFPDQTEEGLARQLITALYKNKLCSNSIQRSEIDEFANDFINRKDTPPANPRSVSHLDIMRLLTLNAWSHVHNSLSKLYPELFMERYGTLHEDSMRANVSIKKSQQIALNIARLYRIYKRNKSNDEWACTVDKTQKVFEFTVSMEWRPEYNENGIIWGGIASVRSLDVLNGADNEDIKRVISIFDPQKSGK